MTVEHGLLTRTVLFQHHMIAKRDALNSPWELFDDGPTIDEQVQEWVNRTGNAIVTASALRATTWGGWTKSCSFAVLWWAWLLFTGRHWRVIMSSETSPQTPIATPPQSPAQTLPASRSRPSQDVELAIMQRLAHTLGAAVKTLEAAEPTSIYVVFIPAADPPVITEHSTREEVVVRLSELRQLQMEEDDPEQEHHVFIFQGTRWRIVKGRIWKLYDGKELIDMAPQAIEDFVDESGSLRDPVPLDNAVEEPEAQAEFDELVEEDI